MVTVDEALTKSRTIIENYMHDIDDFFSDEHDQIDIREYIENRSTAVLLDFFNIIRDLVVKIHDLSTGDAWDLAEVLADEIEALKSIINVLKSDLDAKNSDLDAKNSLLEKLTLELGGKTTASPLNKLPKEIENKVRTFLGGRKTRRLTRRKNASSRKKYLFS
tara:strand:+ start:2432 stop:2920 length:489 start_codon:yes stop_codon:yes gene_type:complete